MDSAVQDSINIFAELSMWWVAVCVLTGGLFSYVLYQKDAPWSQTTNRLLTGARFVLVTLICLLLLGFFIRQTRYISEAPIWVFAFDNSESVSLVNDSSRIAEDLSKLKGLTQTLRNNNFDIELKSLDGSLPAVDSLRFDAQSSDLSHLLKSVQAEYENKNLAGVVLFSDGIFNQGIAPDYLPYNFELHTVGIGDTVAQKDVSLKALFHNKLAYLGNKFPIVAEISAQGFAGKELSVTLSSGGNIISVKKASLTRESESVQAEFLAEASKTGMQHYVVSVSPLEGEFTTENNTRHAYIEVIDSKEKVLLAARSPHPDIKAIRAAIEQNENYEFSLYIPGISKLEPTEQYDLIIFHQFPAKSAKMKRIYEELKTKSKAHFYVVGGQTDLKALNDENAGINFQSFSSQTDRVFPVFNEDFSRFTFESEKREHLSDLPPVSVPFGEVTASGNSQVMLFQRVGSIQTSKPLLAVSDDNGRKTAVMLGEGIWMWRLQEHSEHESYEATDALINKTVQYLSSKEDKRKFRVYTTSAEFYDTEEVVFKVEVYNDIYEQISGRNIELTISDEDGKSRNYRFVNSSTDFRYQVSGLPEGVYSFKASTEFNGEVQSVSGQFTVRSLQLEAVNTTADFNLLRSLAGQNRGTFIHSDNQEALLGVLNTRKPQNILHGTEEFAEIINLWQIALGLILLAAMEWFFRKFRGGY